MAIPAAPNDLESLDVAPGILHKLAAIAGSNNFDTDDAVTLVRTDPALTARIFSLCRSVEYSRGSPPDSIHDAIIRIGAKELYRLTMGVAVARITSQSTHLYRGSSQYFWQRAVITAVTMEEMAPDSISREHAYTAGLMHLVGVWILCRKHLADDTLIESSDLTEMARFEKLRFGVAFAQVGAAALERWGFAKDVCEAVCWQNEPDLAEDPASVEFARALQSAVRMSEIILAMGDSKDPGPAHPLTPERAELAARIKTRSDRLLAAFKS